MTKAPNQFEKWRRAFRPVAASISFSARNRCCVAMLFDDSPCHREDRSPTYAEPLTCNNQ